MKKSVIDVAAAVIVRDGEVLAARRAPGKHLEGYWEFPGGKVEDDESPEDCLKRELAEEFSISSVVGDFIGESVFDYGDKVIRLLGYVVEHTGGDFELVDHDALRWMQIDQLTELKWAPADIPLVERYMAVAQTSEFYATHAKDYCEETARFDVVNLYHSFLKHLSLGADILDLGCGSGRDSKVFRELGYRVTSVDGDANIAAWAEAFTGHPVAVKSFQQLDYRDEFDGVWASASLLHCPQDQLKVVIDKVLLSLKARGVAYVSFKWGKCPSIDEKGRFFTNHTTHSLNSFLESIQDCEILQLWESEMELRDKPQRWACAVIRKREGCI